MDFLWLTAATVLKTFRISRAKDSAGNTIEPKIEFHPGVVWYVSTSPYAIE